jgi:3-hydroxyisobutyrate dehydrogenase
MGLPMLRRLMQAGHQVDVADLLPVVELGPPAGRVLSTTPPADACAAAEVVISMLPSAEAVLDCAAQAMPTMRRGATWIDMGSNSPATGHSLAAYAEPRGIELLDAPVGGGPSEAAAGTLACYVGGEQAVLDRRRAVLECLVEPGRIHHLGAHGAGYAGKLLINLLWFGQVVAHTEALLVGRGAGIEPSAFYAALRTSAVAGAFVDHGLGALLAGDYLPTFGLEGCYGELVAVSELAAQTGAPFALSTVVADVYRRALDEFGPVMGELMAAALLEKQAGQLLRL